MSAAQVKEMFDIDTKQNFGGDDPYGLKAEQRRKDDAYDWSKDKDILKDKKGWTTHELNGIKVKKQKELERRKAEFKQIEAQLKERDDQFRILNMDEDVKFASILTE